MDYEDDYAMIRRLESENIELRAKLNRMASEHREELIRLREENARLAKGFQEWTFTLVDDEFNRTPLEIADIGHADKIVTLHIGDRFAGPIIIKGSK